VADHNFLQQMGYLLHLQNDIVPVEPALFRGIPRKPPASAPVAELNLQAAPAEKSHSAPSQ
jgi:hypothetical protein